MIDRTEQVENERAATAALLREQSTRIASERRMEQLDDIVESIPACLIVVAADDFSPIC